MDVCVVAVVPELIEPAVIAPVTVIPVLPPTHKFPPKLASLDPITRPFKLISSATTN